MKIFIGLTEVSGYYSNLKKGFDAIGADVTFVSLYEHPFQYGGYDDRWIASFARYCVKKRVGLRQNQFLPRLFWFIMTGVSRLILFVWAAAKFDIFILGGGSSFFRFREFPLLHLLGKKIIYMFHGTDCRPAYIDGIFESWHILEGVDPWDDSVAWHLEKSSVTKKEAITDVYIRVSRQRKRDVQSIERYAKAVINFPPQSHFHTRPFVHGLIVGIPCQLPALQPLAAPAPVRDNRSIRILHCPSHRGGKGTDEIRKAIESLQKKGHAIEYIEISGKPNAYVLAEIGRCDFVVDQLYSDTPMAGFAREAACQGKPAVVGGYYSTLVHEDLPERYMPPSQYCHPNHIESAIEKLVTDAAFRVELGDKARRFVETNWTADKVAASYLKIINDDIPHDWIFDHRKVRYLQGGGLPEARVKAILRAILDKAGKDALQLSDKPELERAFVEFAYAENG